MEKPQFHNINWRQPCNTCIWSIYVYIYI